MTSSVFKSRIAETVFLCSVLVITGCTSLFAGQVTNGSEPDLTISKVDISQGRTPSEAFPYYEFLAEVTIKNDGTDLVSPQVFLNAGDDQENLKITNRDEFLSLRDGEEFTVRYQVLKSSLDSQQFKFCIDSGDSYHSKQSGGKVTERNEDNNHLFVYIP